MRSFIILLLAFCCASHADARWQYTKWGMTIDQVLSANKDVRRLSPENQKAQEIRSLGSALAEAPYVADGTPTNAVFYFKSNKLRAVRLNLRGSGDGYRLLESLSSVYGKSIREFERPVLDACKETRREWHDIKRGNVVTISILACSNVGPYKGMGSSSILYEPLRSKGETGL